MGASIPAKPPRGFEPFLLGAAWAAAYFVARAILEKASLATWLRVMVAFLPLPLFAAFLWSYVRMVRAMDELQRKIHLEALGIAFCLALLLLTTLALMQRAIHLSFENWSYAHIWFYLPIFYFGAIPIVAKRYAAE